MAKDLGLVSAYGAAKEGGYTGTFEEYKEKMLELLNLELENVGFSGDYNDLTNKPSLAAVATSGSYNDLSNKPTIPSGGVTGVKGNSESSYRSGNVNLTAANLGLASVATSGSYNDLSNKPTIPTNTDAKVAQTNTTTNADYRVLFSNTANDSTLTEGARKSSKLTFNPSTGALSATSFTGIFKLDHYWRMTTIGPTINSKLNLSAGGEVYGASYTLPTSELPSKWKPVAISGIGMEGNNYTNCAIVECRFDDRTLYYGVKNHGSVAVSLSIKICYFCLPYSYFS